jgi:hypothetical protein
VPYDPKCSLLRAKWRVSICQVMTALVAKFLHFKKINCSAYHPVMNNCETEPSESLQFLTRLVTEITLVRNEMEL